MIRNIIRLNLVNITKGSLAEVGLIGTLTLFINI